jgi:hypothetical protein
MALGPPSGSQGGSARLEDIMFTMRHARRVLPAALLAAGALVSASACSANVYAIRSPYVDVDKRAHDNGYREGFEEGRNDARQHRAFSLDRHDKYRDANQGYRGGGERDPYRRAFRRGFEDGYREAFERVAREGDRDRR